MSELRRQSGAPTQTYRVFAWAMSSVVFSVYMVRCADGSLYTGIATDVARRLSEHQSSTKGAKYLRGRGPLRLVFAQAVGDRSNASRVEHHLKALAKTDKEALVKGVMTLAEVTAGLESTQASGTAGG